DLLPRALPTLARLLALLLHPTPGLRAPAEVLAKNAASRSQLWKFAVSGDLPILLVQLRDPENSALLSELLQAQAFWRGRGVSFDLVVLNEQASGYSGELDDRLLRTIAHHHAEAWLQHNGGVFLVRTDQLSEVDRGLLLTAARVVLDGAAGSL